MFWNEASEDAHCARVRCAYRMFNYFVCYTNLSAAICFAGSVLRFATEYCFVSFAFPFFIDIRPTPCATPFHALFKILKYPFLCARDDKMLLSALSAANGVNAVNAATDQKNFVTHTELWKLRYRRIFRREREVEIRYAFYLRFRFSLICAPNRLDSTRRGWNSTYYYLYYILRAKSNELACLEAVPVYVRGSFVCSLIISLWEDVWRVQNDFFVY